MTNRDMWISAVRKEFGDIETITRSQAELVAFKHKVPRPTFLFNGKEFRISNGVYRMPDVHASKVTLEMKTTKTKVKVTRQRQAAVLNTVPVAAAPVPETNSVREHEVSLVPFTANGYVKFGHFDDVLSIVASKKFYPIFITGLSGNGKTMMVEQVCAKSKREMFRVNITIETDEDDLLGGFRLVNGQTVWHNGPVISAMERGAVLLLDEVDLASNKIMCLQPILEGKPVFLKKINKLVHPAPGFTVVATANTKGRGSDDGKFIGTNVLNEAFLERFSITMEQEYPSTTTEHKILNNVMLASGVEDPKAASFVELLVKWADIIRRSYYDGATSEIVSTRRLVHIVEAYAIFKQDRMKALNLCLNRFDDETKVTFLDLYTKVDAEANPPVANTFAEAVQTTEENEKVSF